MLAIVIPYFKNDFFEATLQSLSDQTDKRFKVYIGDDASPNSCLATLEKFKENFEFVYHRFDGNLGGASLVEQWQRCIELLNGEKWIMILGDDDLLENNCVAEFYHQLNEIEYNDCNLIRYSSMLVDAFGNEMSHKFFHPKIELYSDSFYRKIKNETRSSLSEYIFKKEIYEKYKFVHYPLAWHSDDMAWIEFSDSKFVYTINESTVYIRFSEINISGRQDNEDLKNIATLQFLRDIITGKFELFKSHQRLAILMKFEVFIKSKRKLKLKEWLFLYKYYLLHFRPLSTIKFTRRFLISIFNL